MNISEQSQRQMQELQMLEHQLQQFLMQRQAFQIELNETLNAVEELKKTNDEVYKIIGEVMLKSDKETLLKELEEKKKLAEMKINSVEKQEKLLEGKIETSRKELMKLANKPSEKSK